jgi:hypothetical protein
VASGDTTQDRLDIRSYIDTARKHGKNTMDILRDLMLGRPWPTARTRRSTRNHQLETVLPITTRAWAECLR